MKYNININQKAIIDNQLKLDIVDCAIFDFIREFAHSDSCKKMNSNNKIYFWIKWNLVVKNMPILGINTRQGINKRLNNLKNSGLLSSHEDNKIMNTSWFCFAEKSDLLFFSKFTPVNENLHPPVNENLHPPVNENLHNNIHNIYNKNNFNNSERTHSKKSKKEEFSNEIIYPYSSEKFRGAWQNFLTHRKEIKKPFKSIMSEQACLKKLSVFCEEYAIELIESAIAGGWQGVVFAETQENYKKWLKNKNNNQNGITDNKQQWNGNKPNFDNITKMYRELAESGDF